MKVKGERRNKKNLNTILSKMFETIFGNVSYFQESLFIRYIVKWVPNILKVKINPICGKLSYSDKDLKESWKHYVYTLLNILNPLKGKIFSYYAICIELSLWNSLKILWPSQNIWTLIDLFPYVFEVVLRQFFSFSLISCTLIGYTRSRDFRTIG